MPWPHGINPSLPLAQRGSAQRGGHVQTRAFLPTKGPARTSSLRELFPGNLPATLHCPYSGSHLPAGCQALQWSPSGWCEAGGGVGGARLLLPGQEVFPMHRGPAQQAASSSGLPSCVLRELLPGRAPLPVSATLLPPRVQPEFWHFMDLSPAPYFFPLISFSFCFPLPSLFIFS